MPDFPDIIGAAGLALAFVAFYIGFKRHGEAMTALQALIRNAAARPGSAE